MPDAAVDAVPDAPDALGTCRVVTDIGSVVMEMNVATAMPAPQGGGIADGTYKLTAMSHYTGVGGTTGPTGVMGSQTSYLAAGLSHVVSTQNGIPRYEHYTVEPSGTAITIKQTCPVMATTTLTSYTQTGGVVTFYDSVNAASREYTLVP